MEFDPFTIGVLMVAFCWSGFVRAGLGFGGAGLMYPIALIAIDSVLFLVPIISIQLLVLSCITLIKDYRLINWKVVSAFFALILPTFMIGVFGLITLPESWTLGIVYAVITFYSLGYIFNWDTQKAGKWLAPPSLIIGGYVSGLSLSGAPLIAAVIIKKLAKEQIRASLFALWVILVCIKLLTLYSYDVDLQLEHQLWLFPCAILGHLMGMKAHDRLLMMEGVIFYRYLGAGLLAVSLLSMGKHF